MFLSVSNVRIVVTSLGTSKNEENCGKRGGSVGSTRMVEFARGRFKSSSRFVRQTRRRAVLEGRENFRLEIVGRRYHLGYKHLIFRGVAFATLQERRLVPRQQPTATVPSRYLRHVAKPCAHEPRTTCCE